MYSPMSHRVFGGGQLIEKYAIQPFSMILCFMSIEKTEKFLQTFFDELEKMNFFFALL